MDSPDAVAHADFYRQENEDLKLHIRLIRLHNTELADDLREARARIAHLEHKYLSKPHRI